MKNLLKCVTMLSLISIIVAVSFAAGQQTSARQEVASQASWPFASFGPPQPGTGYSIGNAITLRRAPCPRSPVVATVKDVAPNDFDHPLEISGMSGAFLHLRHNQVEGWASLREALPHTLAFVLDAKTGATLARLPVGAGQKDIVFSPDGSRALIYGPTPSGLAAAYEYNAKDFAPTRTITATGVHGKPVEVLAVFFGGHSQTLYAVVQDDARADNSDFAIVRVREKSAAAEPPVFRGSGIDMVISPDGRWGFVLRSMDRDNSDWHMREATIDVLDLGNFTLRNTITLTGELASAFLSDIVTSFDGSELYLLGDVSRLRVLNSATGKEMRQIRTGWEPNPELSLQNLCSGGRWLLLAANGNACEVTVPEGAWWVKGDAAVRAQAFALACDTEKARYGVSDGTLLFSFAADGRLVKKAAIRQPNLLADRQMSSVLSLAANPNGSRLILFVAYSEEFCPC